MKTQHTPGPWAVIESASGKPLIVADHPQHEGDIAKCQDTGEGRANARLIAADEHAALIESASAIEDAYESIYAALPGGPIPEWFVRLEAAAKQARAAIAKATRTTHKP